MKHIYYFQISKDKIRVFSERDGKRRLIKYCGEPFFKMDTEAAIGDLFAWWKGISSFSENEDELCFCVCGDNHENVCNFINSEFSALNSINPNTLSYGWYTNFLLCECKAVNSIRLLDGKGESVEEIRNNRHLSNTELYVYTYPEYGNYENSIAPERSRVNECDNSPFFEYLHNGYEYPAR